MWLWILGEFKSGAKYIIVIFGEPKPEGADVPAQWKQQIERLEM